MSPARRGVRTVVALLTVSGMTALAGCGSGGDEGSGSASSSPSRSSSSTVDLSALGGVTLRQADKALPTADQVEHADSKGALHCKPGQVTRNCPKRRGTTYATVTYYLDGTATKQDIKQRNGTHWQPESVSLQVFRYVDRATARRSQRQVTSAAKRSAGPLRAKPKRFANGAYQLGAVGKVGYDGAAVLGLPGYTMHIDRRYTSPSGTTSDPENVGVVGATFGRYLVYTTVATWPSLHASGTARAMARRLTADYVERLQQEQ